MAQGVKRAELVGGYEIRYFKEDASQSFKVGQFVIFNSSNSQKIKLMSDEPTADKQALVGMALKDATGTENSEIPVAVFKPGTLVRFSVYNATPSNAVSTPADIGKHVPIINNSNKAVVDIANKVLPSNANASGCSFIVVRMEGSDDSEQYRRIICAVKPMHCALFGEYTTET